MFIYQVRQRVFRFDAEVEPIFNWPLETKIQFYLQPLQPFGMKAGGGRTAVRGVAGKMLFNANNGVHTIESKQPLRPLKVLIEDPTGIFSIDGNVLSITKTFESLKGLQDEIEGVYFCLPILLNVTFVDTPIIERVEGSVGEHNFRWELANWNLAADITTQELQETRVAQAWHRLPTITGQNRRLMAAAHYFHVACRLDRKGDTPGEFLPEVLLNLAKTLEALFPAGGDGKSMEAARKGLRQLGYPDEAIERDFIPSVALRNTVGVGHVMMSLFTRDQLKVLHEYTERAETVFRVLLENVILKVDSDEFEIAPYELRKPSNSVIQIIERLEANND